MMPRDLPLGNGSLLVAFDENYQIRDLYWPHVGQKNHALGHPFRMGVWVEGNFHWLDDLGWERDLRYEHERMVTSVELKHPDIALSIHATDAVDFHENLLVRRFEVTNPLEREQEVRRFFPLNSTQPDAHSLLLDGGRSGLRVGRSDQPVGPPVRTAVLHRSHGKILAPVVDQPPSGPKSFAARSL
jgi:GH15 family glucan-1,4-alpha-glucosidase